jgi:hypothetical protein
MKEPIPLFFRWRERKQRDGSGKRGNYKISFFNLKFNLDNINKKKNENQTWYKANAGLLKKVAFP